MKSISLLFSVKLIKLGRRKKEYEKLLNKKRTQK